MGILTAVALFGWIIAVVEWVLLRRPTKLPPLNDKGHRGYQVVDEHARQALIKILELGGLKPAMRFKIGPTDQTLMSDGYTVINLMDPNYPDPTAQYSGTFISLVNDDPESAAGKAVGILGKLDSSVKCWQLPIPGKKPLCPIFSQRLGFTITFRQHAMKLGPPPGQIPV